MDATNGLVGVWSSWAWAVTWQLAALALLALVCEKALRVRQARARYALWWFVLAAPLLLAPGRVVLERREAVVQMAPPAAIANAVVHLGSSFPSGEAAMLGRSLPPATVRIAQRRPLRAADLVALAWLAGCAVLLARLLVGHLRLRRMLRESRAAADGGVLRVLAELCSKAGVMRVVCLRVSEAVGAPVLYGLRRPVILAPAGWIESLAPDELRALLAHEVAHVKRRDVLANLIQRLVEISVFFHPGTWLASRGITLAREELCDAWALNTGADAADYARTLTAAAERAQAHLNIASVGVVEGRSTLRKRVEAIMQGDRLKSLSRPLAVVLVMVLVIAVGMLVGLQVRGSGEASASNEVPLTAARPADLTSIVTDAFGNIIFIINLKHLDAIYVTWLFGKVDLPSSVGAPKGKGSMAGLLPKGIKSLTPVGFPSKQLLVTGTPEAVADLLELIGLMDREVQQVYAEVTFLAAPKATASSLPAYIAAIGPLPREFTTAPGGRRGEERGTSFYQRRFSTMNLGLSYMIVPAMQKVPQMFLATTPRINGDGSVTFTLALSNPIVKAESADLLAGPVFWQQIVNVQNLKPVVLEVSQGDWTGTLVIRPIILPPTPFATP